MDGVEGELGGRGEGGGEVGDVSSLGPGLKLLLPKECRKLQCILKETPSPCIILHNDSSCHLLCMYYMPAILHTGIISFF